MINDEWWNGEYFEVKVGKTSESRIFRMKGLHGFGMPAVCGIPSSVSSVVQTGIAEMAHLGNKLAKKQRFGKVEKNIKIILQTLRQHISFVKSK